MNKKTFLLLIIFLLTGCYDYKELNTISIVSASAISKINDEYNVSVQVINSQAPDKTVTIQAPFIIYKGTAKTLQEAYRIITTESSRFLYSNHSQILLIDENIAKENITDFLDFYLRNPAIRTEFYVLLSKSNDTLTIIPPIDEQSAISIKETLTINSSYLGTSILFTFNELANMAMNPNIEIVLPVIETINKSQEGKEIKNTESTEVTTKYKLNNLAIFKDNSLIGYLDKSESLTYNIVKNNIKNTIISYECEPTKYISTEITSSKSKVTYKDGEINITVKMKGNINESDCDIALDNDKEFNKINKEIEKKLKNDITKNIDNIRNKYNSDIFGFLDLIYKYDPKKYKEIKDTWYKDIYKNIKININTNIDLISKGGSLDKPNKENK